MIWVVGDIHGMFDPLRRILSVIQNFERQYNEPIERIIFLGDYIDHGPCSKEVIDLIQGLKYDKVCLMGNHEDLAMRFMKNHTLFLEENGPNWFVNGYFDTYKSIFDDDKSFDFIKKIRKIALDLRNNISKNSKDFNPYDDVCLPIKYEKFISNLTYSHQEIFRLDSSEVTFSFFHALPNTQYPIDEQKVNTYDDFNQFILKKSKEYLRMHRYFYYTTSNLSHFYATELNYSSIWMREYTYKFDFEGQVVIHGHTPTLFFRDNELFSDVESEGFDNQFLTYDIASALPFLFSRFDKAQFLPPQPTGDIIVSQPIPCHHYLTDDVRGVEAINIDTGAVYGGALTALGLSPKYLNRGLMPFLTVPTCKSYRDCKTRLQAIKFDKLGYLNPNR
jgi:calcineurin-like phosphoesterase family protein